jgi:hypothetical protein
LLRAKTSIKTIGPAGAPMAMRATATATWPK